jgi:pilus assembly protein CpaF
MLPDGSRVNIIGPPLTQYGPCLTIRKFPTKRWKLDELAGFEMLDQRMAQFLKACVYGRMNILISGGTGSGKTTLLNALASQIPKGERIVTIEDVPELAIGHFNSVKLQTKPQTPASAPVTARELTANALRMRPDRIIIGECRRGEAFDMLQAMNTGHEGSMTTVHANSARDALARVETLCMLGGVELPLNAIRRQIASALDLIIQIKRFRTSQRRVVAINEITGMEGEMITLQEIFAFDTHSKTQDATEGAGKFVCTGFVPTFLDRLRENGVDLPKAFFA